MSEKKGIPCPLDFFGKPLWQLELKPHLWILLPFRVQSLFIDQIMGLTLATPEHHFNYASLVGSGGFGSIYFGTKKLEMLNLLKVTLPESSVAISLNSRRWKKKLDGLWQFPAAFKVISSKQEPHFVNDEINSLIQARGIPGIPTLYDVFIDPIDHEITASDSCMLIQPFFWLGMTRMMIM